jgi:hypothetical protein
MKRLFAMISLVCLFASCEKHQMHQQEEEGQDCVVSLNMVGEITTSEGSLTRSVPSTNDLYAVQVYKEVSNGNETFASGIFDDMSLCKLNLKKGSSYSVRICMVRDAKNYLGDKFSLTNNGVQPSSSVGPFYWYNTYSSSKSYNCTNCLYYNSNGYTQFYSNSTSTSPSAYTSYNDFELSRIRVGKINDISYPTCTDWFYGEVNGYSPNGETATLDVVLRRTGFKLKYELSGVTDGEVTVKVYNGARTFIENTTNTASYESEEQFIAFSDTDGAWQYADDYMENMTVAVTWKRSIGVTQNLGTKVIQVKRNCLNNIKITLGSDDKGAGLSLSTEAESSMGATSSTIPVSPAQ